MTDAPRRQPSRIGVDLQVRGSVVGDGWLQLEGQIKGDVHVGRLFVEETGAVEGAVSAEAVEVGGRIQGPITAREVRVAATGYVQGDITTEQPTSQFDPTSAAIFMVLGNDLESLAKKHRVYTSADVARQAFKKVTNPTDAAVRSVQGSFNFTSLRDSAAGNPDLQKLFKDADVKLNPRYGTWEKGKGPVDNASNWIKGSAEPALN